MSGRYRQQEQGTGPTEADDDEDDTNYPDIVRPGSSRNGGR